MILKRYPVDCFIMDDGFQNPGLAKDLSIVAVDPAYGVGNGQVFPAGPLRERLIDGLSRADAIVLLGDADCEGEWLQDFTKPVLRARLEPAGIVPEGKLVASSMLIVNPPYTLAGTLHGVLPALSARLSLSDAGGWRVEAVDG